MQVSLVLNACVCDRVGKSPKMKRTVEGKKRRTHQLSTCIANGELEVRGRVYKVTSYLNVTKRGLVDDHDTEKN